MINSKYRFNLQRDDIFKPVAVVSNFTNKREFHQRGAFTIHSESNDALSSFSEFKEFSKCVTIPKDSKHKILAELSKLYIIEYSIFPDFEGMKNQVKLRKGLFNI